MSAYMELRALRAQLEAAEAEVNLAWTQANRANAKVKAWEATMVCHGLPLRVCPVDGWGPGADGAVSVPSLTTEKLTQLLDRLSTAQARAEAAEAEVAEMRKRLLYLITDGGVEGFDGVDQDVYEHACDIAVTNGREELNDDDLVVSLCDLIDAARTKEQQA